MGLVPSAVGWSKEAAGARHGKPIPVGAGPRRRAGGRCWVELAEIIAVHGVRLS